MFREFEEGSIVKFDEGSIYYNWVIFFEIIKRISDITYKVYVIKELNHPSPIANKTEWINQTLELPIGDWPDIWITTVISRKEMVMECLK